MDKISEAAEKVSNLFDDMELTPQEGAAVLERLTGSLIRITLAMQAAEKRQLSLN